MLLGRTRDASFNKFVFLLAANIKITFAGKTGRMRAKRFLKVGICLLAAVALTALILLWALESSARPFAPSGEATFVWVPALEDVV